MPREGDFRKAQQKANRRPTVSLRRFQLIAVVAVRVKRRGKSPPDGSATNHARQAPSGARPNRGGGWPGQCLPGRLLEGAGDCSPRLMAVAASAEAVQNPAYRPTSNDYFMLLMWQCFAKSFPLFHFCGKEAGHPCQEAYAALCGQSRGMGECHPREDAGWRGSPGEGH